MIFENDITPGYYWRYMPNALRRLRLEMDMEGCAMDEALDLGNPEHFFGMEFPTMKHRHLGLDRFGQSLPAELFESVRKWVELLKYDGQKWSHLRIHYSLYPERNENIVSPALQAELQHLHYVRRRLHREIKEDVPRQNKSFVKMPFADMEEDFDFRAEIWGNPRDTILERLNRELLPNRPFGEPDNVGRLHSHELHSVVFPEQMIIFKKFLLDSYRVECLVVGRDPNEGFIDAVENF